MPVPRPTGQSRHSKILFRRCPDCGPDSARLSLTAGQRSHHEGCNICWRTGGCFFCRHPAYSGPGQNFCALILRSQSDAVASGPTALVTAQPHWPDFPASLPHWKHYFRVASTSYPALAQPGRDSRRLKHPCRRDTPQYKPARRIAAAFHLAVPNEDRAGFHHHAVNPRIIFADDFLITHPVLEAKTGTSFTRQTSHALRLSVILSFDAQKNHVKPD